MNKYESDIWEEFDMFCIKILAVLMHTCITEVKQQVFFVFFFGNTLKIVKKIFL